MAQPKFDEVKRAIKQLEAAYATLAVASTRRVIASQAWDQAQAHLTRATADESRARDEIAEARIALYALVDDILKEPQ